jgi:hypothetical protein
MSEESKYEAEYQKVEPELLMKPEEFRRIQKGWPSTARGLSDKKRRDFFATSKWYAQDRMSLSSLEGIVVGKKDFAEALEEAKKKGYYTP